MNDVILNVYIVRQMRQDDFRASKHFRVLELLLEKRCPMCLMESMRMSFHCPPESLSAYLAFCDKPHSLSSPTGRSPGLLNQENGGGGGGRGTQSILIVLSIVVENCHGGGISHVPVLVQCSYVLLGVKLVIYVKGKMDVRSKSR